MKLEMNLSKLSDEEILKIAEPIWENIIRSSNLKDWDSFSKDMSTSIKSKGLKRNVEKQWKNSELLTSLSEKREFIAVMRREAAVGVLWKQYSTKIEGEFLGYLLIKNEDGDVKYTAAKIL